MSFLTLEGVALRTTDGQLLFSDLSFSLGRERIGLVGRNGCGKSTLLRALASGHSPALAGGTISCNGTRGLLEQDWPSTCAVAQVLGVEADLARLARVAAGAGTMEDFAEADWTLEERLVAALKRVGLPGVGLDRAVAGLSGGERTRVGLARLALEAPDVLLLDEPTNNLDAAGRDGVEQLVRTWPGGVLVASHDRALLEGMDRIVELSPIGVHCVAGGWSEFVAVRDARRARAEAELERSGENLRQVRRRAQADREAKDARDRAGRAFAARGSEPKILLGRQAERAENSTGRMNRLAERQAGVAEERLAQARAQVEVLVPVRMDVPRSGLPGGAEVLSLEGVVLERSGRRFGPWSLSMRGAERVAVTGPNGAGKTTLLRMAVGEMTPSLGAVRRSSSRVAWFDQHVGQLVREDDILTNYRRCNPRVGEQDARAALARFGFRNTDALQRVATLSGGERLRAGLACVLAGDEPPWLLVMDEPTNHLDIASVELLEQALRDFDGALLVVSHDRAFLEAIGIGREIELAR